MRRYTKEGARLGDARPLCSPACFFFGLISPLCDTHGGPDCFVSGWNRRLAPCYASDGFQFAGRMTAESNNETPGKMWEHHKTGSYGFSSQRPRRPYRQDSTTSSAALGLITPFAISKIKQKITQCSFLDLFVSLLSAALLFRNWFGGKNNLCFLFVCHSFRYLTLAFWECAASGQ